MSKSSSSLEEFKRRFAGFLSPCPPLLNPLGAQLLAAVQSYPNLHTVFILYG